MPSPSSFRILVIEDDLRMVEVLRKGLHECGHSVVTATTAGDGKELMKHQVFDTVVLDVGLPDESGLLVAEQLRNQPGRPAIIMLTAFLGEDNVVSGLDSGADDYLTKPFSFEELQARILSVSNSLQRLRRKWVNFGGCRLYLRQHRLMDRFAEVHLSRSEYFALRELALHQGDTVTRRRLMLAVWNTTEVSQGALDTLIASLRDKLGDAAQFIVTVRGLGYTLRVDQPAFGDYR